MMRGRRGRGDARGDARWGRVVAIGAMAVRASVHVSDAERCDRRALGGEMRADER